MRREQARMLEETLHQEVPLTRHMGVRVEDHDGRELVIKAGLEPNINIHGTAFGGSLYSICAVTCWGLLHLQSEEAGLDVHSVLGQAEVSYHLPVRGEIECRCRLPDDETFGPYLQSLREGNKARIRMTAEVLVDGQVAVRFQGRFTSYF